MAAKSSILFLTIASLAFGATYAALSASSQSSLGGSNNAASSSVAVSASPVDKAQRAYVAGRLPEAMAQLEPWLKTHPTDAVAHYLQANCLLKAGRNAEASYEYARAEQLAPASKIAQYCRAAQSQLTIKTEPKVRSKKNENAEEDADQTDEPAAETENAGKVPSIGKAAAYAPRPNTKLPPGTLELIRKQAEMARRRALVDGATEADNERLKATNEARSLQEKAERLAGRSRVGNEPITLSPEEKDRLRSQSAASSELLKQIGELKAAQAEEGSRYKAEEIQRQSEHLQEQLLDDRIGGSKLNPVGTNLYIRNYAKPPVAAMRAQIRSLSTNADLSSKQTSIMLNRKNSTVLTGEHSSAARGDGQAETHVKGEVLDR